MTIIASVLHLDRHAIKALSLTDPYALHKAVYSLYDDVRSPDAKKSSEASGILYADQGGDFNGRKIILLANRPPANHIAGQYGAIQSKEISSAFLDHAEYRFKVIVNPTRRENASRKIVPVRGREAIAEWFTQRAPQNWGFEISPAHLQVDRVELLQFKDKQQNAVTLAQAHVQGQLKVIDRQKFQNSFVRGIGRGRAFGCGLLQILPVLDNLFV